MKFRDILALILTFSSSFFYLSLVRSHKFTTELLGCPLNSRPLFLYSLWAKNNPGMKTLLFETTADLCRGYGGGGGSHSTKTPRTELIPSLLHEPFLKKICRERPNLRRRLSLAPFTSHEHISPNVLHSDAASSVLLKIKVNHMMELWVVSKPTENKRQEIIHVDKKKGKKKHSQHLICRQQMME